MLPSLDQDTVRVYAALLARAQRTPDELAQDCGLPATSVRALLADLTELRLATSADGEHWCAISPDAAAAELLDPVEGRLRARQHALEQQLEEARGLRRSLADLGPLYYESRRGSAPASGLDLLSGAETVRAALTAAAYECREEVLAIQPGSVHRQAALEDAAPRDIAALARGVRHRFLYHHSARANLALRAYVNRVHPAGAEIRTVPEVYARMIVFDRKTAFLASPEASAAEGQPTETVPSALVVRDSTVIAHLCGMFEILWQDGTPLLPGESGYGKAGEEMGKAVAELLAQGLKDEAVARRLGVSVRSARRHIAALVGELKAESRFQAGVLAVRSGLLREDAPDAGTAEHTA
ncbi:hypothetical protein [Streptomyces sp. NPDC090025]|uniref:hypothetical protein n=1 Tax=Streptomyces sp. NPDC090025 TaxID=3365922 RepID=UPI0038331767